MYKSLKISTGDRNKVKPLVEAFKQYCAGRINKTVVRYRFNTHNQTTESMDEYIAELRNKIPDCRYTEDNIEESLLTDRIVLGVACEELR